MSLEIVLSAVASMVGGSLVAGTTALVSRKKVDAESDVLRAQAERERAEAKRILSGIGGREERPDMSTEAPLGWWPAGKSPDDYEMGVVRGPSFTGNACAYIRAVGRPAGFGTLMQTCAADDFAGKRVRLVGVVRTEAAKLAALWMRIDGPNDVTFAIDNMHDRPIAGTTDWRRYAIVLDVPARSEAISYGLILDGTGAAYLDSVVLESVTDDVETTEPTASLPRSPVNSTFTEIPS